MDYQHNKELTPVARNLRKQMTKEEKHLWYDFLKTYPVRFRRQHVVGNYILDFYCAQAGLVIELDGTQHYEDKGLEKDSIRNAFLESCGLTVIHISNKELNENFKGVCISLDEWIKNALATP